jgi:C1A family cysteine protease
MQMQMQMQMQMKILIYIIIFSYINNCSAEQNFFIHPITLETHIVPFYSNTPEAWNLWKQENQISFSDDGYRYTIFKLNVDKINIHNNRPNITYIQKPNKYMSFTKNEFQSSLLNSFLKTEGSKKKTTQHKIELSDYSTNIPSSINWFSLSGSPRVYNQGSCGSCYIFSTLSAIEYLYYIQYNVSPYLSRQQLVDCVYDTSGCNGGSADAVFSYIQQNGICYAENYQYIDSYGACQAKNPDVCLKANVIKPNLMTIVNNNVNDITLSVSKSPIVVYMDASGIDFYYIGLYDGSGCTNQVNHAVLMVGYGDGLFINTIGKSSPYFIIQNSWGTAWGEDGLMYISQNANCGILDYGNILSLSLAFDNMTLPNNIYIDNSINWSSAILIIVFILAGCVILSLLFFIYTLIKYIKYKKTLTAPATSTEMIQTNHNNVAINIKSKE